MITSKIDVSAEKVSIPLDLLTKVAGIAVGRSRVAIERTLHDVQQFQAKNQQEPCYYLSEQLAQAASDFHQSMQIYYALTVSNSRESLDIVRWGSQSQNMKTQTINQAQLAEILGNVKGATPITISALVSARARKTGNPYKDVLKLSKVNGMTGANYEASVNRQQMREGHAATFEVKARSWGERIGPALVKGTKEDPEKLFAVIQIQSSAEPIYFGQQSSGRLLHVAKSKIADFLPEHTRTGNQGTEKEIVYRNYALENIAALSIGGKKYRVRDDTPKKEPAPKKKRPLSKSFRNMAATSQELETIQNDQPEGWDEHKEYSR